MSREESEMLQTTSARPVMHHYYYSKKISKNANLTEYEQGFDVTREAQGESVCMGDLGCCRVHGF